MRPYNTYRNPELSQPVSSVENTLTDKASNASFDILRSLSESISVDCGSFEISAPTEYYQTSSVPPQAAFVAPDGKEIRTPVERVSAAPVNAEPSIKPNWVGSPVESGSAENAFSETKPAPTVCAASRSSLENKTLSSRPSGFAPEPLSEDSAPDMDDDDYDCMNDPYYRAQDDNASDSPSFEELMARASESIARMREENSAASPDKRPEKRDNPASSTAPQPQIKSKAETARSVPKPSTKASADAPTESSAKKGFLSSISWDKTRKLLFSRETIKLTFLSLAVSALIVSAVIYKTSPRQNKGLPESEDVVVSQPASDMPNVSVENNNDNFGNDKLSASNNDNYWNSQNENWNSSIASNPETITPYQDDYQSPSFDADAFNQNDSNGYLSYEDSGHQIVSPHSSNNGNQFVDSIPTYNAEPEYARVAPAVGSKYNANDYESPLLEDDTVPGEYSETGFNSNFMR